MKKTIDLLVTVIILMSVFACIIGLFSAGGPGEYTYRAITGENVEIYGSGIYKNDSVSLVAQGKAGDFVTLVLGVPLLLASLYLVNKNSFRGKLLLTGTLGYFLYTYMSYTFLWTYNPLFIVYVLLMSMSLYGFILSFMSFDMEKVGASFSDKLPVKFIAGFQFFIGFTIGMMWLGRIAPTLIGGTVPAGLEHYTTLVIQGMDLGIIVPAAFLSGILLIRRKPMGYLLSSVIIIKGTTMCTAITAMIINMALKGVEMNLAEALIFPIFNLLAVTCLVLLMKNIVPLSQGLMAPLMKKVPPGPG